MPVIAALAISMIRDFWIGRLGRRCDRARFDVGGAASRPASRGDRGGDHVCRRKRAGRLCARPRRAQSECSDRPLAALGAAEVGRTLRRSACRAGGSRRYAARRRRRAVARRWRACRSFGLDRRVGGDRRAAGRGSLAPATPCAAARSTPARHSTSGPPLSPAQSTYAGIVRMVEAAQTAKAPFMRMADRFAIFLLPATLIVAGCRMVLRRAIRSARSPFSSSQPRAR